MKTIAIPILMLLLMTQTFSKWSLILQYEWNKKYIASILCENKSKPQLHCNGNCVLMKKMKAEEQQHTPSNNQPIKITTLETIFVCDPGDYTISPGMQEQTVFNTTYLTRKYISPHFSIFHPPIFS
jgi:hypothetical protein